MIGMMTSPTSELTIAPKAAPMMTPTARSTTLPFIANSWNSFSTLEPSLRSRGEECALFVNSIAQAGMDRRAAHGNPRRLRNRHHRQAQLLFQFAKQRQRVLDRRGIAFDEEIGVEGHQLVVQLQRGGEIALLPGDMKFGAQPRRDIGGHRDAAVTAMRHVAEHGGVLARQLVEILAQSGTLLRYPHHAGGRVLDAGDVLQLEQS